MLAVHNCSHTRFLGHLSTPRILQSIISEQITSDSHLFVQSIPNLMEILEMQKKFQKIFFDLKIIAFDLAALNTRFYSEKILFIGCQYVNKQSQDFRYY